MDVDLLLRLLITWIIPGGLAVLVGIKKNRRDFGILIGLLFGGLGFVFGLCLGWIGFIVVCCFKKNEKGN